MDNAQTNAQKTQDEELKASTEFIENSTAILKELTKIIQNETQSRDQKREAFMEAVRAVNEQPHEKGDTSQIKIGTEEFLNMFLVGLGAIIGKFQSASLNRDESGKIEIKIVLSPPAKQA